MTPDVPLTQKQSSPDEHPMGFPHWLKSEQMGSVGVGVAQTVVVVASLVIEVVLEVTVGAGLSMHEQTVLMYEAGSFFNWESCAAGLSGVGLLGLSVAARFSKVGAATGMRLMLFWSSGGHVDIVVV